jgi:O86/O127-antigen biosynthesis alpha-1,3-N-acetylgalactosaminyltransferase
MKTHICYIITKSEIGGAQKWVKEQIDILDTYQYTCFLVTNQTDWLTRNSKTKLNLTNKKIEKRFSIYFLFQLIEFIYRNDIDLIVGNSANGGIYARIAALLTKTKVIYVSHGWSSVYNGGQLAFIYNSIERILSFITDTIICVSQSDYNTAVNKIKINPKKIVVIPNKIFPPTKEFANQTNTKNTSNGIIRLLFLGRLTHPKNPFPLIEAIQNNPKYMLDIVGTGENIGIIESYLKKGQITNVQLCGEIKNFNSFHKYDMFCLISQSEGLPISAIEALSCGLPILISNVGGCGEVIENNGYLTDNTPHDILNGIQIIENNFDNYSSNSYQLFSSKFDLQKNFQEYISLIYKTINNTEFK